jgi:crotonobetainyl-CoA:carnitine CoA-transferase CaiB-like acyl-CoA transferase
MTLPLEGIRVADFTWVWAGPFCTLQLAHLGAEVIRVESTTRTCVTRLLPPFADGEPGRNRSGYFNQYNQGKLSLALDLKQPEAIAVAKDLVAQCDVVCENFAAGVMDRMGLGYETLRALRPDLVMIALSGYGATGPDSEFVSYGPAQVPLSGMSSLTGYADWPPMHVGISYGDPTGGLHGAFAVLAALWHRANTGAGQYIDLSQWETSVATLGEGVLEQSLTGTQPPRSGNRDPTWRRTASSAAPASSAGWRSRCATTTTGAASPRAWARRTSPRSALRHRRGAQSERGRARGARRRMDAIAARHRRGHGAAGGAHSRRGGADEPGHRRGRGPAAQRLSRLREHPEVGTRLHLGIPWQMSETPCTVRRAAPCLGQHTDDVLRRVVGYDEDRIAALRAAGILT